MKTLVIGNGAREHAITWKLQQSDLVSELLVAPGNAGTAQIAENVPIAATDIDGLLDYVKNTSVEFTVVGPEGPLANGIVDRFQAAGLLVFGPTQSAARIESSKVFSKDLMLAEGVPTGQARTFSSYEDAKGYIETCPLPTVIKADGLAAGKGVIVAETRQDALTALKEIMDDRQFGEAGDSVLIEEYLQGQEVSVFAFVDGDYVSPMAAACDYKRVGDGNVGPNTGGMGSFSPPRQDHWNCEVEAQVRREIMEPVAKAMVRLGCPYSGVLYLGIMLTQDGLKVIEFNCRLGDPETQVVLPRLRTDLAQIMLATAKGELRGLDIIWSDDAYVGVVMASGGYPDSYKTGHAIKGLDGLEPGVTIFQAGTRLSSGGEVVTDGGRVLTATAAGKSLADARRKVYDNLHNIHFQDSFYRTDIAACI
ncbi:MAG: phosphoribosylamine--glycine ligase [SAR202 cluster bacterium Casp-Chloro-G4]|nr:phosphoribosylamine--glycine ligase [Chloroflexota bacterium]MDA1228623.1 phosphoribosylamine--glycine ligase [Chloroflexota bacterium]PKB61982.1 MAG: phosphoribosylamine--glycine ligase [SAR202 cluster bacterium Casp-Chloro-G4]